MPTRGEAIAALTAPGEPFELERVKDSGATLRVFKNAPSSLGALYRENVSDADFLVYEGERITFAEAYRAAAAIATVLVSDYGVVKGDRVAIAMRNYPEWILSFMATTSIGGIAVAINARWQAEELAYAVADCGAKLVIADQERLNRLSQGSPKLDLPVLVVRPTRPQSEADMWLTERLLSVGDVAMPTASVDQTDAAVIIYTSGSTGRPKGALSPHRSLITTLMSWELEIKIAELISGVQPGPPPHQSAALLGVPLFHATGLHNGCLFSYRAQRKLVLMYKWDPLTAAELIEREQITAFVAPSTMTGDLLEVAGRSARDLRSLRHVGGGGAPRAPEQVRALSARFGSAAVGTGWGMTETNCIGTQIGGQDYLDHPASSGRCSAVMEIKIVNNDSVEVPAGQRGEVLVRGTAMFREYWRRPDVNATAWTAEGWFRTGDVALLDNEGYLYVVDRIKDLIIRGGENIGSGEVEAALLMHPDVHEAAVYGLPDERLGEQVGATIYANPTINVETLREFLHGHLARFEVPSHILTTDRPLPRTASGKIFKRQIRHEALIAMGTVKPGSAPIETTK